MTIKELKVLLEDYDEDTEVVMWGNTETWKGAPAYSAPTLDYVESPPTPDGLEGAPGLLFLE